MATQTILKYGMTWNAASSPLEIEFACIKKGGIWKRKDGSTAGLGLFQHYRNAMSLLWPHEEHNRWSDLMLENIITNTVTVVLGPKSSGKTHSAAKFALLDYFMYPDETTVLVSSTDLRGLELRVWGDLKSMLRQAKDLYDWLPGNVLDSKHAVSTDSISEEGFRDMRNGIICIPCLSSTGTYTGLGRYVGAKNKRMRLVADECFPTGTLVDTPNGQKPIEMLNAGDYVLSAIGPSRIKGTIKKKTDSLVTIKCRDGRVLQCTANHPFLTQYGWTFALALCREHYILSQDEAMRILRQNDGEQAFLFNELHREVDDNNTGRKGIFLHEKKGSKDKHSEVCYAQKQARACYQSKGENAFQQPNEIPTDKNEGEYCSQSHWMEASSKGRKWARSNRARETTSITSGRFDLQFCGSYESKTRLWTPNSLQDRCRTSKINAGYRGRWRKPQFSQQEIEGYKEDKFSHGTWVDSVEVQECSSDGKIGTGFGSCEVFNLEVEGHPSFSVSGLLAHNCQFMKTSFLEAISNLDANPDFKAILIGNPLGPQEPLCMAGEPKDGWNSIGDVTKTMVWNSRFLNGKTINLVGTDSPNFDFPQDKPPKYPFLIHKAKIDSTVAFYGMNSHQYYSQCLGVMKAGLDAHRVITHEMCRQFKATEDVIWDGSRTRIYAIDAAYGNIGGDRCIGGSIEFGKDLSGKIVISVGKPVVIPVSVRSDKMPEDQIAQFVMEQCVSDGIPPENVYFDATGRGSLGTAFARVWSAQVNPVEFGGMPTLRPVSLDIHIRDVKTGARRLKTCREHYSKFVTELWYSWRYAIESGQMKNLPYEVIEEGCMREWKTVRGDKIEVESKVETKERMGRSPDLADWLVCAIEGARRKGFMISKLASGEVYEEDGWMDQLKRDSFNWRTKGQLNYAA